MFGLPRNGTGSYGFYLLIRSAAKARRSLGPPWDPYWGWYGGWDYWGGCPGCGWGYPWAPVTTVVTYRTGSIIIEMVDPTATSSTDDGPAWNMRWGAILNGLAEGENIAGRVDTAIDQAFAQSPYLGS